MPLTPELAARRRAERTRLIGCRLAAPAADHARWSAAIEASLEAAFAGLAGGVVGVCWPFQAEFDARGFVQGLARRGARLALPVVVGKGQPLEFHEWWPGVAMAEGAYGVPVPQGTPRLEPDALLIPAVGVGPAGDRLGYGGGFFDRTLAASAPRPVAIAVAFELSRLATSEPQPHDVLMDFVVTEAGIEANTPAGLVRASPAEAARRYAELAARRGLPRRSMAARAG